MFLLFLLFLLLINLSVFADAGRLPWREPGLSCFAPSQLRCLCPAPSGQRVSIPGCRNVNGRLAATVPVTPPFLRAVSCAFCTP
ncbi:hypothetical protein ACFQVU_004769, partial [Salmonella enterica]